MHTTNPEDRILTPEMLRRRASVHREAADAMAVDAQYTDSSQARLAIEERVREHRARAAALEAEANTLEADLAAAPKEPRHV